MIALLTIGAAACGGEPGELPASSEPVAVSASTSASGTAVTTAPASVVATRQAQLATRIAGTIRSVAVDIGADVTEGQALVRLDKRDVDARIASAEASAQLARQWHQRITALAEDGAATAQELDDASARLEMADAALRDARAQLAYVVLRAPFSGVITARHADPGNLTVPGMPVLEMIGSGDLKIEADLPGELAGRVAVGDLIGVYQPESGARYSARISRAAPALERSSRRFRIEARFESETRALQGMPPGTFVRIELDEPASTTRWIPTDVVVSRGQLRGVFVVEHEELRLRWVRLGEQVGEAIELLAGPGPDRLMVRNPAPSLVDGQPVADVRKVDWHPPFATPQTARTEAGQ